MPVGWCSSMHHWLSSFVAREYTLLCGYSVRRTFLLFVCLFFRLFVYTHGFFFDDMNGKMNGLGLEMRYPHSRTYPWRQFHRSTHDRSSRNRASACV
ncbi:hypothetical protein BDN72DRAFT_608322 [Pluteus cervinus]|uniref:Uncharacterized protein n=1 Tax=Pluteus cervinus TaxID=181527 RepID=A0ACD3AVH1_9AGAR|nr:hypothetical protein BDN72DRAFT_608322 [Pluteus cervinus]